MNRLFAAVALAITIGAVFLQTQNQTFTRIVVDGHVLRVLVKGTGTPVVVFENGLGGPLENWGKVQPAVSRFATTVSYDRAGVGLSEGGPPATDGRRVATELRTVLQSVGVPPPYILVGHSLGGPFIRSFARLYPELIAGMVLVDPNPGRAVDGTPRSGTPVVLIDSLSPVDVPFATQRLRAQRAAYLRENAADARAYREWLDTIPGSRLLVTRRSGHNIPQEEPALVIETVRSLVRQLRSSGADGQAPRAEMRR
jgi:pimeloyl-ACP methyl ester carboxylesterase